MAKSLRPSKAPNLLIAPTQYQQQYIDQLNNALRLYFNQVDNFTGSIMQNAGGRFLNFPNLFISNGTTQYATGDNTATLVSWGTVAKNEGFTIGANTFTPTFSGAYRFDYRLQAENYDSSIRTVYVWLKLNGVDVPNSCTKFTVPSGSGGEAYTVCASFIELDLTGDSELRLYWATDKAATSGGGLGVYLEAYPAQVSPFAAPAIPSAYGSITFVSELD